MYCTVRNQALQCYCTSVPRTLRLVQLLHMLVHMFVTHRLVRGATKMTHDAPKHSWRRARHVVRFQLFFGAVVVAGQNGHESGCDLRDVQVVHGFLVQRPWSCERERERKKEKESEREREKNRSERERLVGVLPTDHALTTMLIVLPLRNVTAMESAAPSFKRRAVVDNTMV